MTFPALPLPAPASTSVAGPPAATLLVTPRAAARIATLIAAEGHDLCGALRVRVDGGGCSGFQYVFDLVPAPEPDDTLITEGAARVLVDPVSLPYLAGSELDYVDDLMGASFRVRNPNATASCGCGTSFSV